MASAQNAGFFASRGEVVIFLDSDDVLLPEAVELAMHFFGDSSVVKVHWPIWETDAFLNKTGRIIPERPLLEGDLRERLILEGPDACIGPLLHGNAWSRHFLNRVLPIPQTVFRRHSDMYLLTLAPLFGAIKAIHQPQGYYRVHGANDYACRPVDEKNERNLEMYRRRCRILHDQLQAMGIAVDPTCWEQTAGYQWMLQRHLATEEIKGLVPTGESLILVDEQQWSDHWGGGQVITDRKSIPFLERHGQYWGPPADDESALRELSRLQRSGATCIAFAWPAFWWLEHYPAFHRHLRAHFPCVIENERLVVFDLRQPRQIPAQLADHSGMRCPAAPRRTRLYGVGAAKSGTKSIADCFRKGLRSEHEAESEQTIDAILAVARGQLSRAKLRDWVLERDRRLALEVDSSQLNYFILDELLALFPDARFVLTIRDPYSWLDSFINHQLNRPTTIRWRHLRDLRFRAAELKHPAEETALERRGLYTLDGYLCYWNEHNQKVLSSVSAGQLMVVRTDQISQRLDEITTFAGVSGDAVDIANSHSNRADRKHRVLAELDAEYLASKVHQHCQPSMHEYFGDVVTCGVADAPQFPQRSSFASLEQK
jgi:hypothetical protein